MPSRRPPRRAVYPRASGGTEYAESPSASVSGLSPRERGNHGAPGRVVVGARSIPARAGEPGSPPTTPAGTAVYPRASGGTSLITVSVGCPTGLSPRERGNLTAYTPHADDERSIPARAGEPCSRPLPTSPTTVYPRASGGTPLGHRGMHYLNGLSPRERGNQGGVLGATGGARSIPARAGEPLDDGAVGPRDGVYPRASGGTPVLISRPMLRTGLSPRERGNPACSRTGASVARSIPARAGEPPGDADRQAAREVYPRASGGTSTEQWRVSTR